MTKAVRRKRPAKKSAKKKTTKQPPKTKGKKKKVDHGEQGFAGKSAISAVIYGPPGVGKTSVAAHFPKVGFIIDDQEEGILTLSEYGLCPKPQFIETAKDFEHLLELCNDVAAGEYDIQTLVLDSITGFEKLCFLYHCDEYFDGDWSSKGFFSYFQGPKNAAKVDWPRLMNALDDVRRSGVNVLLLGHSQPKTYNNPEGADYDRHTPYCDKDIWQVTHRWTKALIFYNYAVTVDKKGVRNKANQDSEDRFLNTEWSPAFDAKNQYGLEPLIDAGESGEDAYKALEAAFVSAGK